MPGMATDRQPTARPPAGLDNDDVRRRGTTVAVTLRALARLVARRARTLGSRARLWLVLGLGFSVFTRREAIPPVATRRSLSEIPI